MSARGKHRGHAMTFDEAADVWRYDADGVPVPDDPSRACGYCGLSDTAEGHDGCLGTLPGVMNACCGHGEPAECYVQYESGVCVRGLCAFRSMLPCGYPNRELAFLRERKS